MKTKKILMATTKILLSIGGTGSGLSLLGMFACQNPKYLEFFNVFFVSGVISALILAFGVLSLALLGLHESLALGKLANEIHAKFEQKPTKEASEDDKRTRQIFSQLTTPGLWPCE
jgi:hypothetical membrane protein